MTDRAASTDYSAVSSTQAIMMHAAFGGVQMPQLALQQT
jgi:hypothetical protein